MLTCVCADVRSDHCCFVTKLRHDQWLPNKTSSPAVMEYFVASPISCVRSAKETRTTSGVALASLGDFFAMGGPWLISQPSAARLWLPRSVRRSRPQPPPVPRSTKRARARARIDSNDDRQAAVAAALRHCSFAAKKNTQTTPVRRREGGRIGASQTDHVIAAARYWVRRSIVLVGASRARCSDSAEISERTERDGKRGHRDKDDD
uniref:Uncharacterized protein n=1 Tax=Steinernema glaseri TaxID=37863 RepID=A0A1I7ZM56_9BILA